MSELMRTEEWSARDGYLADFPEENRTYVLCDHCRSTLLLRPYLHEGEIYMECQVCTFTYRRGGILGKFLAERH